MEKRTRSSRVLNVINRAQSGAVCRYNQNCQVHISVSEVTAVKLTASTVATQLSVSFGSEPAHSISLVSQDGDDVLLLVESPIVTAAGIVDVTVQGSDESGALLTAASIAGFKFKNAASGSLEFIGGSPLTGKAISTLGTTSTLRVGNFPDDIAQSDIQVTVGGSVVSTISSFSVSETFEAKITILVPNATGCSSQSCVEDGYVSVTSRNLQTSFSFTYFEKDAPDISSYYPSAGIVTGNSEVQFLVSNLATDETGNYAYDAANLVFTFGSSSPVAAQSTAKGKNGQVAVTVITPAAATRRSSAINYEAVTMTVNDADFTNQGAAATESFGFYPDTPFIEALSPASATIWQHHTVYRKHSEYSCLRCQ